MYSAYLEKNYRTICNANFSIIKQSGGANLYII